MKKIRVLDVEFENEITASEVPAFRGAIIETAGRKNILFHNHNQKKFIYSYPLIQYKRINKRPHLICINRGVDEIHKFFENMQEGVFLNERAYELKIGNLSLNTTDVRMCERAIHYNLTNWIPISQKNYSTYNGIKDENDKIQFLNKILTGNILSFAKGIGWTIDKPIITKIDKIDKTKSLRIKGVSKIAFDLSFKTNVLLPDNIGLGKSSSLGFGVIKKEKK